MENQLEKNEGQSKLLKVLKEYPHIWKTESSL